MSTKTYQQNPDGSWTPAKPIGPRVVSWRDVDSERFRFGVTCWAKGGQVNIGHRVYRWRVTR